MGNAWNTFLFLAAGCCVAGWLSIDERMVVLIRRKQPYGSHFIAAAGLVVMTAVCLLMVER